MENLKALVYKGDLTPYQRALAKREFEGIVERLEIYEKAVKNNAVLPPVVRCLSPEIESMHYQSRDKNQCYLQSLLTEAKGKGNLAMELIYALEKHLNK